MNFIKPNEDNFVTVCEHCKAIVELSIDDCYCVKQIDTFSLLSGDFQNITKVYFICPHCHKKQDVIAGLKYVQNDKEWFRD